MKILRGIVNGMDYMHSRNPMFIHRDLKTRNILIDKTFHPYLCDFGFARVKAQNQTMTKCGTAAYQAPEILQGKRYTEKADVYSFGIVMWEVETRQTPYDGMDAISVAQSVLNGKRPIYPESFDSSFKHTTSKCLEADPSERPSFSQLKSLI
eukprot:TRINITY_DN3489_c0_g1_i14.p1 TRINITY_DN3489_c0_g1~~TRINITY_DN3489_c0_g1_i14.p1  ORF type:complete len:152 (-),score=30.13 TRINITY_DN3489_c0_g1_i14:111-566(-)